MLYQHMWQYGRFAVHRSCLSCTQSAGCAFRGMGNVERCSCWRIWIEFIGDITDHHCASLFSAKLELLVAAVLDVWLDEIKFPSWRVQEWDFDAPRNELKLKFFPEADLLVLDVLIDSLAFAVVGLSRCHDQAKPSSRVLGVVAFLLESNEFVV